MLISRRSLLSAAPALIAAPAIVKASSLMPVFSYRERVFSDASPRTIYLRQKLVSLYGQSQFPVSVAMGNVEWSLDKTLWHHSPAHIGVGDQVVMVGY